MYRARRGGKGRSGTSGGKAARPLRKRMPLRAVPPPKEIAGRRDAATNRRVLQTLRARHHRFARSAAVEDRAPAIRKGGGSAGGSAAKFWQAASIGLTTSDATTRTMREFKAALRAMKRSQQLIRQSASVLRQTEAEAQRRVVRPTRPVHSSRAALWRWYKANGWSWERFVADHGLG